MKLNPNIEIANMFVKVIHENIAKEYTVFWDKKYKDVDNTDLLALI